MSEGEKKDGTSPRRPPPCNMLIARYVVEIERSHVKVIIAGKGECRILFVETSSCSIDVVHSDKQFSFTSNNVGLLRSFVQFVVLCIFDIGEIKPTTT